MKTALKYGAGLLALYLVVFNFTGSGDILTGASTGSVDLVKAFQGR